jgi:WD40 repeat protein
MSWPLSQDYNEAIQSPARNFADSDLKRGAVATNALGLPMPYSGNFADVYEVRCPDGSRWAVKCFTREVPDLCQRYEAISRHLHKEKLPFTVDFSFLEEGIRVAGRWFPALKMQWVEGLTLHQFIGRAADKPATLEALLQIWGRMGQYLRAAEVAHCDLQHGNVLLVPGSGSTSLALKLVDYDGMWVPALSGSQSGEVGHPSYQHPRRAREGTYNREVDRFPLLLVATALRALKAGGRPLWEKYDNGDNLLFTEADLLAPTKSHLFLELIRSGDSATATLANQLFDALRGGVESAPLLEEPMPEARPAPTPRRVRVIPTAAVKPRQGRQDDPEEATGAAMQVRPIRKVRNSIPLAALIGGGTALMCLVGAIGVYFLMTRGGQKANPTGQVVENRPDDGEGSVRPIGESGSTERKQDAAPTREPGPALADPALAEIDPDPQGPIGEIRQFEGHTAEIRRLAVSPDGRQLLTASFDHTFRLWDVASGREVRLWDGHAGEKVHGIAFLPDGRRALTAGFDKFVHLWDLKSGRLIRTYSGHSQGVWDVAVSGNGRIAASCGSEGTVFLWDVQAGTVLQRLEGNEGGVETVALSGDGKLALTGSMKGPIRLWDVEKGSELRGWKGHADYVMGLAFSPDGKTAFSGSTDQTARFWRLADATELRRFDAVPASVISAVLSPDGNRALTGCTDNEVILWDIKTGKELSRLRGHVGQPWTVAFSPDGRHAFSAGEDKVVRMWRLPPADYVPLVAGKLQSKPPVPDDGALAAAEKEVKEVYKTEYARKKPAEMQALAARLMKENQETTKDRSATRFVLLREARDLVARAGDLPEALHAAEEMANQFAVDVLPMKAAALEAASHKAASAAVHLNVAVIGLALSDRAEEAEDYQTAERLARVAQASAATLTGLPVVAAAQARLKETSAIRKAYESVSDAVGVLATRPDDDDANLALGKFHALIRGDWDRGLGLLARGSDPKLKALAVADLAIPADAGAAVNLADTCTELAASESDPAKTHLLCRACYWYGQAALKLTGIERTKVEKKYAAAEKNILPQRPIVLHASYGAYRGWTDVTDQIRWLLVQSRGQKITFKRNNVDLGIPDPASGENKSLVVVYRFGGGIYLSIGGDEDMATIPGVPEVEPGRLAIGQALHILHARYGNEGRYEDATAKTQAAVCGSTLITNALQLGLGDPFPGRRKAFIVVYRDSGRIRLSISAPEDIVRLGVTPTKP